MTSNNSTQCDAATMKTEMQCDANEYVWNVFFSSRLWKVTVSRIFIRRRQRRSVTFASIRFGAIPRFSFALSVCERTRKCKASHGTAGVGAGDEWQRQKLKNLKWCEWVGISFIYGFFLFFVYHVAAVDAFPVAPSRSLDRSDGKQRWSRRTFGEQEGTTNVLTWSEENEWKMETHCRRDEFYENSFDFTEKFTENPSVDWQWMDTVWTGGGLRVERWWMSPRLINKDDDDDDAYRFHRYNQSQIEVSLVFSLFSTRSFSIPFAIVICMRMLTHE